MKLRSRLAVTLVALVVPFAIIVSLFQARAQREAFEEGTAETVMHRMDAGERFVCERRPEVWPMRRRGPPGRFGPRNRRPRRARRLPPDMELFAYDSTFSSLNPAAPTFDAELRDALESGDEMASRRAGERDQLMAVRMPWDEGPCSILMLRRKGVDAGGAFLRTLTPSLVISLAAILIAVLAAGPVVRRIRRLTDAVRRSERGEKVDVGGRDEITDLAAAFNERDARIQDQIGELEQRDESLRTYMANTTHDVMLPVTVLQGHLSAIERSVEGGRAVSPSRVKDALEECHYLASLVHNLNAATKLEAGARHAELHPTNLDDVIERVIGRHGPFAKKREVSLDYAVPEGPTSVLADVTLVEQAIGNVVHNAVRYNRPEGHVAVVLERREHTFSLRVVDDGPGLPDEELRRIHERGFRGNHARTRHPHGMGLGLSITRDVAERHGWELTFESPSEGGLAVLLSGPLRQQAKAPTE